MTWVKAFDSANLVRLSRSAPVQLGVKVAVLVDLNTKPTKVYIINKNTCNTNQWHEIMVPFINIIEVKKKKKGKLPMSSRLTSNLSKSYLIIFFLWIFKIWTRPASSKAPISRWSYNRPGLWIEHYKDEYMRGCIKERERKGGREYYLRRAGCIRSICWLFQQWRCCSYCENHQSKINNLLVRYWTTGIEKKNKKNLKNFQLF